MGQFDRVIPLKNSYIVGIDQVLVDIEAKVSDEFMERYKLVRNIQVISDETAETLYSDLKSNKLINYEFAEAQSVIHYITFRY